MLSPARFQFQRRLAFGLLCSACLLSPACGPMQNASPQAEKKTDAELAAEQLIRLQELALIQHLATQQTRENADTPPSPAPARNLAPEGVFYLTERISVTTTSGILGFEAGTMAREIIDGVYSIQGEVVELPPLQLTNDLDEAKRIIQAQHNRYHAGRRAREAAAASTTAESPPATAPAQPDPFALQTLRNTPPPAALLPADFPQQPSSPAGGQAFPQEPLQTEEAGALPLEDELDAPPMETAVRSYQSPTTGNRYQIRVTGTKVSE